MTAWWQALPLEQQIFYGIAIVATVILLGQILLSLLGVDHGADVDFAVDHSSGLGVLSVQSVATFFVGFGWVGALWLSHGYGLPMALISGAVVGITLVAAAVFVMRWVLRLQDSGTLDYRNAVGVTGTVYCLISPGRIRGGQIELPLQGRTVFADAVTDATAPLPTGARARVVGVLGPSTLIVEPV